MSADNYYECPKCVTKYRANFAILRRQLTESYGVVPVEEYTKLVKAFKDFNSNQPSFETVRSYEEIYLRENKLTVSVRMSCDEDDCDFEFDYEKNIDINTGLEII